MGKVYIRPTPMLVILELGLGPMESISSKTIGLEVSFIVT